jgi:hypothetical protein
MPRRRDRSDDDYDDEPRPAPQRGPGPFGWGFGMTCGILTAVLIVFVGLPALCCGLGGLSFLGLGKAINDADRIAKEQASSRATAKVGAAPTRFTLTHYEAIRNGMTYEDVFKIMGAHGEEQSRAEVGGHSSVLISWANRDGSNLVVTFSDGRVSAKAQVGLRD